VLLQRVGEVLLVEPDTGPRILGSQAKRYNALYTVLDHSANRVRDERLPVAHPEIDRMAETLLKPLGLQRRYANQWGAATDQLVSVNDLLYDRLGELAAATNVEQELRDIFKTVWSAMGEK
jgi:hypothetical protein